MTDETVQPAEETPAEEEQGITVAERFAINYKVLERLLADPISNKGHRDTMRERLVGAALNITLFEAQSIR